MTHVARAKAHTGTPIETVWRLLSTVDAWPSWSRHKLAHLEREGSPTPDGVGAIRVLGLNPAKPTKCNREQVVTFGSPTHFGYILLSGQPLDNYRADVTLTPLPAGGTCIAWESRFDTHGITGWFWVLVVRSIVKRWSADLAQRAERATASSQIKSEP